LVDGVLVVQGNPHTPNNLSVHSEHNKIWAVTDKGASKPIASSRVQQIRIIGGDKADRIGVDAGIRIPVYVRGLNGNDTIATAAGNDTIIGGNGNDKIDSGAHDDRIKAGKGNDRVWAGSGNDVVDGDGGNDYVDDGKGNDAISAGDGNDTVHSGSG